jgi:hypothetical protein
MKKFNLALTFLLVLGMTLITVHLISAQAQQRDAGQNPQRQRQGQGQAFDPKQMMERRMQQIMERLKLSDEDTKVIKPMIEALTTMRMEQGLVTRDLTDKLQKAIDTKKEDQIKTALTALKDKRKDQKEKYDAAEKELIGENGILTVEQEAILTVMGVVNSDGGGMGFRGGPGGPGGNPQGQGNQQPPPPNTGAGQ